jgi:hypothetical protein
MTPSIIKDKKLHLPEGCELWSYSPDTLVLAGPGMSKDLFTAIKLALPPDIQTRLVGWRRIGKSCHLTTIR